MLSVIPCRPSSLAPLVTEPSSLPAGTAPSWEEVWKHCTPSSSASPPSPWAWSRGSSGDALGAAFQVTKLHFSCWEAAKWDPKPEVSGVCTQKWSRGRELMGTTRVIAWEVGAEGAREAHWSCRLALHTLASSLGIWSCSCVVLLPWLKV